MRIFYVDDSGNESLTTFTAIGIPTRRWGPALRSWLTWRRQLREVHGVDVQYRLHATDWVAGRGRPAEGPHSVLNRSKSARWEVYVAALDVLASMPELQVLTVHHPGSGREAAYRLLMRRLEALLEPESEQALVVIDGASDELRLMHRELDLGSCAIIEDPWKRDAHGSQWLQAADLVAYAAFQHIVRRSDRAFMWHWYERCLGERIVECPTDPS